MHYLLDTNICIYIIKHKPISVRERFNKLKIGDVAISVISLCELQYGIAKSSDPEKNQSVLTQFLAPIDVLDFPATASPIFGKIRSQLERLGTPIGNYDLLIASHAIATNLTLVTNNIKEFERIPELKLENWA